jgi:hypothetical protein
MVVGRRDTWFVSARKDEGKTKTGVGKKVESIVFRRVAVSSLVSCSAADLRYLPPSFLFSSALLKASSSTACLMGTRGSFLPERTKAKPKRGSAKR